MKLLALSLVGAVVSSVGTVLESYGLSVTGWLMMLPMGLMTLVSIVALPTM